MVQTSFIEISRSALQKNIRFIRAFLNEGVKLSCVVKANAYGHGIEKYVPMAEQAGVTHFSVYSADEAFRVKQVCKKTSGIMIMGHIDNTDLQWAIKQNVEFYVFDNSRLEAAIHEAEITGLKARIHLEVETGMNRTGYDLPGVKKALQLIRHYKQVLEFTGMCTHFAGAESIANYVRIQNQIKRFNQIRKIVEQEGMRPLWYHTACSAAAITYPKTQMDMVRIGILQYGFWPTRETYIHYINKHGEPDMPLKRVLTWKSGIMNIKEVRTGEFIGYGTTYLAQSNKRIANVPIGYSHGFSRSLSNVGRVLLHGIRVSVIGIVNMNVMTIDITGISNVNIGDEVVIIGEQGDLEISVASFSELSDQVNYETLTRLPADIPRQIVD